MHLVDGPYNVSAMPDKSPPANQPGWFWGGDPVRGQKATRVTKDWLNTVQAELKNVVEAAGLALDKADDTQLLQALRALFGLSEGPGAGSGSGNNGGRGGSGVVVCEYYDNAA